MVKDEFISLPFKDKIYLLKLEEIVSLLLCSSELLNHLEGGVEVESTEAVSQVEQVHPRLSLEIVDVKGKAGTLHVFGGEFSLNELNESFLNPLTKESV